MQITLLVSLTIVVCYLLPLNQVIIFQRKGGEGAAPLIHWNIPGCAGEGGGCKPTWISLAVIANL